MRIWCLEIRGWLDRGGDEGVVRSEFKMVFWGKIIWKFGYQFIRNMELLKYFILEGRVIIKFGGMEVGLICKRVGCRELNWKINIMDKVLSKGNSIGDGEKGEILSNNNKVKF